MATIDAGHPAPALPRWDLTDLYPALDAPEVAAAEAELADALAGLAALYDRHGVAAGDPLPPATGNGDGQGDSGDGAVAAFEAVLAATNDALERFARLEAFAYAHVSTASDDDRAQALVSRLAGREATVRTLRSRFDAWVGRQDVDGLVARSDAAAAHAWPRRKAARRATHQMSGAEEALAADLAVTGSTAWARLYEDVTSGVTATVTFPDGRVERLGVFAVRGLATDPDAGVRAAAFAAELEAWEAHATPLAAALNALKGETLALDGRRGWGDPLDAVLEASAVGRATFEAMSAAVDAALPDFRRYLHAKARLLDKERLAFWDLFAPVGTADPRSWDEATATVEEAFAGYGEGLAGLARHALEASWVDAGPRIGKVGGGFCLPVGDGRSRILMNFDGSIDSVHTLAHELGHAHHNRTLGHRTPLQRSTPMALAETASIFCETILTDRALAQAADDGERLALLEADLQGACQVVVDIRSRFLFESRLFERRRASNVAVRELCDLMRGAQLDAYGDGLDPDHLHPYMWAAKPHYYGSTFYNWPYTFGLLFGLGLYARWLDGPDGFRSAYDDLLSSTGLGTAADLASRFGIDLDDEAFWAASLDVLRTRIDEFCAAAGGDGGNTAGGSGI
jgi:oligoendopeptidase F